MYNYAYRLCNQLCRHYFCACCTCVPYLTMRLSQVVEIAGLTEHLLTECESKVNFQQCARCTEAILKTEYDRHAADKTHPGRWRLLATGSDTGRWRLMMVISPEYVFYSKFLYYLKWYGSIKVTVTPRID